MPLTGRRAWGGAGADRLARVARACLVALALASVASWLLGLQALVARTRGPDEVTGYEARLAALRRALPPHGVVGYVSDTNDVKFRYLTQYVLAPVVVDPAGRHSLLVGNFSREAAAARFLARGDDAVLARFGNGVVLLRPR